MTDGQDVAGLGLKPDNAADEPANRRGEGRLPLKPGEWNAMSVRLEGGKVTLALNGAAIYERPLEHSNDRLFGFYHDKNATSVRVRNIVLKGDWPESLTAEQLTDLMARRTPDVSPALRRARHAVIGEAVLSGQGGVVLEATRTLPPPARYEALAAWVLPGDDHPSFRLQGEFAPSNPAPPVARNGRKTDAPSLALVDAAKELGKLDELAKRVLEAKPATDLDRRGRLALLSLIQAARGDDTGASATLDEPATHLAKVSPSEPTWSRWPELVAATGALERPALAKAASSILTTMNGQLPEASASDAWAAQVRQALNPPKRVPGALSAHWTPAAVGRAAGRGMGFPSDSVDAVYLNVPVRGEFEFGCELAPGAARIAYGGASVSVLADPKRIEFGPIGRSAINTPIEPPLANLGEWVPYRIVVKNGVISSYVGERMIHEERLADEPDPWLAILFADGVRRGARNLTLSGKPVVPEVLNLSTSADLSGWHAAYYDEPIGGDKPAWEKRAEEIHGRSYEPASNMANSPRGGVVMPNGGGVATTTDALFGVPGSFQESVLQYHRPLFEDGAIDYQFFYDPGKTHVHPALDRLALLLEPDGVRIHWLTDAQYDRTGLDPANRAGDPVSRRGPDKLPLEKGEWNRVRVSLKDDVVTLRLNDVEVFERELEPSNNRVFGLFHFADQTDVRVRDVTYRGSWPRALPGSPDGKLD